MKRPEQKSVGAADAGVAVLLVMVVMELTAQGPAVIPGELVATEELVMVDMVVVGVDAGVVAVLLVMVVLGDTAQGPEVMLVELGATEELVTVDMVVVDVDADMTADTEDASHAEVMSVALEVVLEPDKGAS